MTASPRFRPALRAAEVWPRPLQQPIRVWHGSATSRQSVDLAARYGDPLFSANVTNPIGPYAELIRYYRERWAHYGHDPASIAVGAGTAGYYAARTSQDALDGYRPAFEARLSMQQQLGLEPVFPTLDAQHRASIELFQAEIAPVLRREIPDPPWPWGPVASKPAAGAPATGRAPAVPAGAD